MSVLTCPENRVLEQFLLGQLPEQEAGQIEQHLSQCGQCLASAQTFKAEDTLVEALRAQSAPPADTHDAEIAGLLQQARRLGALADPEPLPTLSGTLRPSLVGNQSGTAGPALDFLSPPQAPGELGRLGGYRVLKVLGQGGMGLVFEAEDPQLKRRVALKVMLPALAAGEAGRQRFLREAQATAAIQHDHIVAIHQVSEERGVPFLAMPLLQGETLEARLRRTAQPLPVGEALRIAREIAAGLAAAHAHGLTHRDIKPANIWLEGNAGRVKILDFGLARAADDDAHLTQSGAVAGTPQYMAPEQATGEAVDHRCDLFGLGCVLYRMTTGQLPFPGATTIAVLRSIVVERPKSPRELNPDLPPTLAGLTLRLLSKNAADRPQTAQAVIDAIGAIEHSLTEQAKARPMPKQRSSWPLVTAATLLLALGAGGYFYGPAIYRLVTNQGVLVVQTSDPAVKVTVKRNGEEVKIVDRKTGHAVTLKAGKYELALSKGKEGLRLSTKEFTLERGGEQIVKVWLEPTPAVGAAVPPLAAVASATPPQRGPATAPPAAATSAADPFVILARGNKTEQPFATLPEAYGAAVDGDTIEIRGNGPFVSERIGVGLPNAPLPPGKSLTIRAAEGFAPVIQVNPADPSPQLLSHRGWLVLEGLDIRSVAGKDQKSFNGGVIHCYHGSLRVAHCRFTLARGQFSIHAIEAGDLGFCEVRHSQFVVGPTNGILAWSPSIGCRLVIENNVLAGDRATIGHWGLGFTKSRPDLRQVSIRLVGNTFVQRGLTFSEPVGIEAADAELKPTPPPFRVDSFTNLFDVGSGIVAGTFLKPPAVGPEGALRRLVDWHERMNAYRENAPFLRLTVYTGGRYEPVLTSQKTPADWEKFWRLADTGTVQGQIQYQHGDVKSKLIGDLEALTPADFRLAAESIGKGAGEGGRDLGADVDAIGPGAAYERWKATSAYQDWLAEIEKTSRPRP